MGAEVEDDQASEVSETFLREVIGECESGHNFAHHGNAAELSPNRNDALFINLEA